MNPAIRVTWTEYLTIWPHSQLNEGLSGMPFMPSIVGRIIVEQWELTKNNQRRQKIPIDGPESDDELE